MGVKWEAVARQPAQPHYLICNADESEPGTFKDRLLLEGDPYAVIEAMTIAAFATNCAHGFVYLRGEYPQAHAILEHALAEARARGLPRRRHPRTGILVRHRDSQGRGRLHLRRGDGDLQLDRGLPRRAAEQAAVPGRRGLFSKPTVINNVETLVNVLDVVLLGGPAFAESGTEGSTGPKLFCLSGHVAQPGVYEVPVRDDAAGAARPGRRRSRRPEPPDRAARRSGRGIRAPGRARSAPDVRGRAGGVDDPRLGRRHGLRRDRRPASRAQADRSLLPRRVVRAVCSVPGWDGAPAGGSGAALERSAHAAAWTPSSR